MKFLKKKKKGFTLIELVAVVAIIGILAALLVPKISEYIQDAKKTKVVDQARKVIQAVETVNIKQDVTINDGLLSTITSTGSGGLDKVYKYIAGDSTDTIDKLLPNIDTTAIKISDCKKVVQYNNFNIDKNGVLKLPSNIATS